LANIHARGNQKIRTSARPTLVLVTMMTILLISFNEPDPTGLRGVLLNRQFLDSCI